MFLFSSEYPAEHMIQYLKNEWNLTNYLSWYGHSEMCVLAYDLASDFNYHPLITYGYAEEVDSMLLGTSFHNFDMPLIRYQTDDLICAKKDSLGMITSFKITGGRASDYIEDIKGQRHSLTFFLGRHHSIYNYADFIQIHQSVSGLATYYIVPSTEFEPSDYDLRTLFDIPLELEIKFDFKIINEPVRTKNGKLKIKLTDDDISTLNINYTSQPDKGD